MKTEEIVEEVKNFWSKKDAYLLNGVLYRRGILMYGSPGGGKSSTIRLISEDCVDRGGVVIIMENPYQFTTAYQDFRKVQPDTPVVVVIEDIDAIVSQYNESAVLNLVDGVVRADNCVFLATTNYPENLGDRIINRPSRFDVRVEIPMPSANARRAFLVAQFERGKVVPDSGQIDQWVKDSVSFSIAHLLELYVGVVVLGKPYDGVMGGLKQMARRVSSSDSAKKVGF
jgi:ATP-dependent 26S proteasome regulatory subunit